VRGRGGQFFRGRDRGDHGGQSGGVLGGAAADGVAQLCFNGVRLREVKARTGFQGKVGPVYARDLPAYLDAGFRKTPAMEQIHFNFLDRLWIGVPFAALLSLIVGALWLLSLGHLSRDLPLWFGACALLIAATYGWLPTRWHLVKGSILGSAAALALAAYLAHAGRPGLEIVRSAVLLLGIQIYVAADFSGSTPVSNRTLSSGNSRASTSWWPACWRLISRCLIWRSVAMVTVDRERCTAAASVWRCVRTRPWRCRETRPGPGDRAGAVYGVRRLRAELSRGAIAGNFGVACLPT